MKPFYKATTKAFTWLLAMSFFIMLISCSDDSDTVTEVESVATEDMADILSGALSKDSQGLVAQMEASTENAQEQDFSQQVPNAGARTEKVAVCGEEIAEAFNRKNAENQVIEFNYEFEYFYAFSCNQIMIPTDVNFTMTQSGDVDAPRFSSSNSSEGGWSISGLEIASNEYNLGGSYERAGLHTSKIRDQNSFDFDMSILFTDVIMNKGTYAISSGTGTFSIAGTDINDTSYSFDGSIEFLGNQELRVTINEDSYIINVRTGDVSPA